MKLKLTYNPTYKCAPTRPPKAAWELWTETHDGGYKIMRIYPITREMTATGWGDFVSVSVLNDLAFLQHAGNEIVITKEDVDHENR